MTTLTWMIGLIAAATSGPATQPVAMTTPVSQPGTQPTTLPTTQPAVSPEVDKVLDAMEAAGGKFLLLTADVRFTEEELLFGERTRYLGRVYYQRDAGGGRGARFRIHFDTIDTGSMKTPEDRDYAFFADEKGQWFITRNARSKRMVKYQVAPAGATTDALELGKGPFPVPFGQRKARVLSLFEVTTRRPQPRDPKATTYLKLIPRPGAKDRLKVRWIELWIDRRGLPVRIRTLDTKGETRSTAEFSKIAANLKLTDADFDLPRPPGWTYEIELLPEEPAAPSMGRPRGGSPSAP